MSRAPLSFAEKAQELDRLRKEATDYIRQVTREH